MGKKRVAVMAFFATSFSFLFFLHLFSHTHKLQYIKYSYIMGGVRRLLSPIHIDIFIYHDLCGCFVWGAYLLESVWVEMVYLQRSNPQNKSAHFQSPSFFTPPFSLPSGSDDVYRSFRRRKRTLAPWTWWPWAHLVRHSAPAPEEVTWQNPSYPSQISFWIWAQAGRSDARWWQAQPLPTGVCLHLAVSRVMSYDE